MKEEKKIHRKLNNILYLELLLPHKSYYLLCINNNDNNNIILFLRFSLPVRFTSICYVSHILCR